MQRVIQQIRELVATPSVSSVVERLDQGNRAVIDLLANWLADGGWTVEIQPISERPAKANLIAALGQGPGGLVLAGHVDTVPYDTSGWTHDPFGGALADGRIYGLGTADMKSFFAVAIAAASAIPLERLKRTLYLVATADEEISMAGARALVDARYPRASYAVIGEPTDLRPVRMHKGILMEHIRIRGRSGHSSDPARGRSALEGMHQVIGELISWRAELQGRHRDPTFDVPEPTLNLGWIHGGDNPNRICSHCELAIDLRPLPGMALEPLRQALHERLARRLEGTDLELQIEAIYPGAPALETPGTSAIVRAAARLSGHEPGAVAFATEAPYYQQLGMEPLVLGPGRIDQAHQPDEYIELATLQPAIALLRGLIEEVCCSPADPAPARSR